MNIIVNARRYTLSAKCKSLTHDQVTMLAFGPVRDAVITITYSKGPDNKPQGSLMGRRIRSPQKRHDLQRSQHQQSMSASTIKATVVSGSIRVRKSLPLSGGWSAPQSQKLLRVVGCFVLGTFKIKESTK